MADDWGVPAGGGGGALVAAEDGEVKLTDRGSSLRFRAGLAAPPAVSTRTVFRSFSDMQR